MRVRACHAASAVLVLLAGSAPAIGAGPVFMGARECGCWSETARNPATPSRSTAAVTGTLAPIGQCLAPRCTLPFLSDFLAPAAGGAEPRARPRAARALARSRGAWTGILEPSYASLRSPPFVAAPPSTTGANRFDPSPRIRTNTRAYAHTRTRASTHTNTYTTANTCTWTNTCAAASIPAPAYTYTHAHMRAPAQTNACVAGRV